MGCSSGDDSIAADAMSEPAAPAPTHVPPPAGTTPGEALDALVALMRILRGPTGCPWDREQTLDTLLPFVLEEAHEVVEAVERRDMDELKGEIGDLMFEGVFLAQLTSETGAFTITDALNDVRAKLVRRHPHVFAPDAGRNAGTAEVTTAAAVLTQWDAIKVAERAEKGRERTSHIDGVPEGLPALLRSSRISAKAATVGFEWPTAAQVLEKIDEELAEVREAMDGADRAHVAEEIGDLLFAVSNLARKLDHDPEALLRAATRKFADRFRAMEARLAEAGTPVGTEAATLDVMEAAWQAGKAR
jgi:MazG family protein